MSSRFTESILEDAALAWLESLGYAVLHGSDIAAGEPGAKQTGIGEVVMPYRCQVGVWQSQATIPMGVLE
jgi:type I restriction enzyme R subunit